jgi:hypothetical protein
VPADVPLFSLHVIASCMYHPVLMRTEIKYLENSDIYRDVVIDGMLKAKSHIFIATANVKDMFVEHEGSYIPIVEKFHELCKNGVEIRLLHSSVPSKRFLKHVEEY